MATAVADEWSKWGGYRIGAGLATTDSEAASTVCRAQRWQLGEYRSEHVPEGLATRDSPFALRKSGVADAHLHLVRRTGVRT
jgi:hypothetical protein